MTDRDNRENRKVDPSYEAPRVESHLDEKEIEREVAYAGDGSQINVAIVSPD